MLLKIYRLFLTQKMTHQYRLFDVRICRYFSIDNNRYRYYKR